MWQLIRSFNFVVYCSFNYNSTSNTKALFPYPSSSLFSVIQRFLVKLNNNT